MLYASENGLRAVESLGHHFNPSTSLSHKLGLAAASYELVSSIPSILDYLGPDISSSFATITAHEEVLQKTLLTYLIAKSGVRVIGEESSDPKKRVSTVAFVVEGRKSNDVVEEVERETNGEIGIRWGGFYSERLRGEVLGLGSDGVVRVSMVHYNTGEFARTCARCLSVMLTCDLVVEVERLLAVLDVVLG